MVQLNHLDCKNAVVMSICPKVHERSADIESTSTEYFQIHAWRICPEVIAVVVPVYPSHHSRLHCAIILESVDRVRTEDIRELRHYRHLRMRLVLPMTGIRVRKQDGVPDLEKRLRRYHVGRCQVAMRRWKELQTAGSDFYEREDNVCLKCITESKYRRCIVRGYMRLRDCVLSRRQSMHL